MSYGTIKVNTVTFTNDGVDKSVTLSGLVQNPTFSGNVTVTGTLSGVTVTGTTANFTSGNFTNISGGTHTITSGVFAAGSAASPSITFTGDLNTGIYSPGADQVAISTGGSGRLFVDASGQVGVGTSSPGAVLHTVSTSAGAATYGTFLQNSDTTTGTEVRLALAANTNLLSANRHAWIGAVNTGGSNSTALTFATNPGGDVGVERLRITSAGNVGIGTTSPGRLLTLNGGGSVSFLQITNTTAGASSSNGLEIYCDGTNAGLINRENGALTFDTNNTERLRITSAGLVGVGTSSPITFFDCVGTGTGVAYFRTTDTGSSNNINIVNGSNFSAGVVGVVSGTGVSGGDVYGLGHTTDTVSNDLTPVLTWTSGNRVGIGTTSPQAVLHTVSTTLGSAMLRMNGNNNYTFELRTETGGAAGNRLDSFIDSGTAQWSWTSSSGERARIDSSGRLLIGTSTSTSTAGAASTVQVASSNPFTGLRWNAGANPSTITLGQSRGAAPGTLSIASNNDSLSRIQFVGDDGTQFVSAASITAAVDGTPGTNDMPGRIVLSTTAAGASSPTERLRITNDGVQAYNQPAPAAVNATATLTVANLKAGIITSTSAAATDMTLPTGTDTEAGFNGVYTNFTFEWSVINTGPSLVRVLAGTAHTIVGSGSVATGTSGRFASRRTAANTFVTYRLS